MDKREVPVSPQSVSEMQPFYEKCWDGWQSCSDVWPKLLPWWVRRFAGAWADSRVQTALAPLQELNRLYAERMMQLIDVGWAGNRVIQCDVSLILQEYVAHLQSDLRDMERQRDGLRERYENLIAWWLEEERRAFTAEPSDINRGAFAAMKRLDFAARAKAASPPVEGGGREKEGSK